MASSFRMVLVSAAFAAILPVLTIIVGNPNAIQDFNMLWIAEFKKTNAYEVWDRITDPLLFDIVEPRLVPCAHC